MPLSLLQYSIRTFEVSSAVDHDFGMKSDLSHHKTAVERLCQLSGCLCFEAHKFQLSILGDGQKSGHKARVHRGDKQVFRSPDSIVPLEFGRRVHL